MKNLKIMTVLITTIIFSGLITGCVDRYHVIHEAYQLDEQCVFERLTPAEEALMSEDTKMKLGRNYKGCFIRQKAEQKRLDEHNALHK